MSASLKQASLSGLRWSAVTQLVGQVATYGSFVLLARLLAPTQMGVIATATMVTGLVAILNEAGLGAAVVQRAELTRGHEAACFWTNLAVGLLLWVALSLLAAPLAGFFHTPLLHAVLWALAPTFPLVALGVLPKALMERGLRFKELGVVEAAASIATGGLSIALALAGYGVWSVVAGAWAGFVVQVGLYWVVAGCRPGGAFTRVELNELWGFGASVLGTRGLGYLVANVDYLIVGRMMGATPLGVYSLAYKLVTLPLARVSYVVIRVAYPAFSRLQGQDEAFRRHYVKMIGTLAAVVFPVLVGLAVLAPEAIDLVFGARWAEAAPITRIMCLVGALKALASTIGVVFMSKGRPEIELKLNLFGAIKLPLFLLVGVQWGLTGVAVAYALSTLTGAPLQQHFANRLMGLSWPRYLQALLPPAAAALAMGWALALWKLLTASQPEALILVGAVPVGVLAYLAALTAVGYDWRTVLMSLAGRGKAQDPTLAAASLEGAAA